METLAKFAFDSSSETTSRNALRVLCNAMLLKPEARQTFVDLGYEHKACSRLKADNWDDEFLVSRVVFLTTYGTTIDLPKLIKEHRLAESIVENLSRHADRCSTHSTGKTKADPMEEMALAETLKLLFNVTRYTSDHISSFDRAVAHIATIFCTHPLPDSKTPLSPPFSLLINALMNLDLASPAARRALYPEKEPTRIVGRLVQLLDLAMKVYTDNDLEQLATPLVCVLSSTYEHAPAEDADGSVRAFVRGRLLPTDEDRKAGLGKAETLPSRLLRNWANPLAPEFRRAVSHLYFDLSGKDAGRFIENVGYGYASGFLFQNKIPVPESAMEGGAEASSSSATRPVNPITGQFLDEEKFPDLPEMTKEEKEREAERLFVLFER